MFLAIKIKIEKTGCSAHTPETLQILLIDFCFKKHWFPHSQAKVKVNPESDDVTEITCL